jgi:sugar O-acyltransferase (sialic acid O-acetyltransferase NeuD family)
MEQGLIFANLSMLRNPQNNMKSISVLGFGGHASTVREACELAGWSIAGFYVEEGFQSAFLAADGDQKPKRVSRSEKLNPKDFDSNIFALGIGDNCARLWWCEKLLREGFLLPRVSHTHSWVSPSACLAEGVFVAAGAVVQAGAQIGRAALINSNATVEHHSQVGSGAHIGSGAVLAGLVEVGDLTMVGAGAVIRDRIKIGNSVTVGAGAAVVRDVPDQITVVGVPAKVLRQS